MSAPRDTSPFLQRWSRLKQQDGEDTGSTVDATSAHLPAAEANARPELPPVESLGMDSDFTPWLANNVAETLRRKALRRLFHLPQFNVVDGLDDYAEDFTAFEPLGDTITHELRRFLEREAREAMEQEQPPTPVGEQGHRQELEPKPEPESVLTGQEQEGEQPA